MNKRNSRRAVVMLGLCFLFIAILTSTNIVGSNSQDVLRVPSIEPALAQTSEEAISNDASVANCRYGIVAGNSLEQHVPRFGAGWFLDFNPPVGTRPVPANNAEFIHVLKVKQNKSESGEYLPGYQVIVPLDEDFANYLQQNPGGLWAIGNEVDRGPNPGQIHGGQGDMYPETYAVAYHEIRAFIKEHDPTARTAISGLVQVTPSRLRYLDRIWDAYFRRYGTPMPVDVWNMHVYVLPEVEADGITPNGIANIPVGVDPKLGKRASGGDPGACSDPDVYCYAEHDDLAIFSRQVIAMRQWMKEHGQQQKPLILSEFSILYPYIDDGSTCFLQDEYGNCFTPDRVSSFMKRSSDYLNQLKDQNLGYALDENRLVQQWTWFSLHAAGAGVASNLLEDDLQTLTEVGWAFRQKVLTQPQVFNLVTDNVPNLAAGVDDTGKATVTLRVVFRNNGNTAINEPILIGFYRNKPLTRRIGLTEVTEMVRGCATNTYEATVQWTDLTPGRYWFWTVLDNGDLIVEGPPNQQDNYGGGIVTVSKVVNYFPIVR